jgi:prepilin-type N-terminal cleavage/methylation domain-containing protein
MKLLRPRPSARSGFSLIEIVVVLTILSIIAGATLPTIQTARNIQAKRSTRAELQQLGTAALEYARDFEALPTDVVDLLEDTGDARWAGPYLGLTMDDEWSGLGGWSVDGWSEVYDLNVVGDLLAITSGGPDRTTGNADDLVLTVDPSPVWRAETLGRLGVINQAIVQYNAQFLATDPLPPTWSVALGKLIATGFLPTGAPEYARDAWGDSYEADPSGSLPVVRATSPNL